jgi:hypothetical protein
MPIDKKQPSIKYTSRDFNTIRNDLIEYARRYYPDSFKDFSEASFGSLMVDSVAYIGDILSFYLDYQANESFLPTANEYGNIVKHGKALGYKLTETPSSYGTVTLFVKIPSSPTAGPDLDYFPILQRGTMFSTTGGTTYMLTNDINFADSANEIVVAAVNESTGAPSEYAVRAYGEVVSGMLGAKEVDIGNFERFKRIELANPNITEVLSVTDSDGNRYFEVDYLSQNTIYRPVENTGINKSIVPNLLKPFIAMRRFVVERERGRLFLQFGFGSEKNLSNEGILNPDDIVLKRHGRDYNINTSFDPTKLIQTDKFGVSPSNTTLRIVYRMNNRATVNTGAGTIINVNNANFKFIDAASLDLSKKNTIATSLEVTNEEPIIGDVTYPSTNEVKRRIYDTYTAQNRAVTAQDYKAMIYMMPSKYGSIKRCNILQDPDAFKRNLNIYVVSEDSSGNLTKTNDTIKNNLKNWINQYRMLNDTIDILDAKIANIGINFTIAATREADKFTVLARAESALKENFLSIGEISEPINIADIYRILNLVPGVSDTIDVTLEGKSGALYSNTGFNVEDNISSDGRYLIPPEDVVCEIKYLDADIKGHIR